MNRPRFACQTYSWQMSGKYVGSLDHIVNLLGETGFAGVEPETQFLGRLADPVELAGALKRNGIGLAAICLVEDWLEGTENPGERRRADECIALLEHFPGTLLNLCQMPTTRPVDPAALATRQEDLLSCVRDVAERASARGIVSAYHPNSPAQSIFRTAGDYEVLLAGLDDRLGWIPDTGHIARGGMDPLRLIEAHRGLIRHIHYKDMDAAGRWAEMGRGVIDHEAITRYLVETGYSGWFVVEDESERAKPEPDQVTLEDWTWIERHLVPLLP